MESFDDSTVTLLNYVRVPSSDDGYGWSTKGQEAQSYLENLPDTGTSCNDAAQAIRQGASSSTSMNSQGNFNCDAVGNDLAAVHMNSTTPGPRKMPPPYEYFVNNLPVEHMGSPCYSDAMQLSPALDCVELGNGPNEPRVCSNSILDIGPPPTSLPRLDSTFSMDMRDYPTNYPGSRASSLGSYSSPQSPMVPDSTCRKGFVSHRNRTKIQPIRSSSPMFPDQSTPLSNIVRQNIHSTLSSKLSENYNTISSVDSGIYSVHPSDCSSSVNSPSVFPMDQGSPSSNFTAIKAQHETTSSKHFVELEVPNKHAKRISELDKKILKLQAERSKIMERLHHTNQTGNSSLEHDMDFLVYTDKPAEMGKVKLYIYPLGIKELDEPLFDEGSKLLRKVGGLYLDLQAAVTAMRNICCKGVFLLADISTCFSFIKSLLPEEQKLTLLKADNIYSIQLVQSERDVKPTHGPEFFESLEAANEVLRCAQLITLSYNTVQTELRKARELAKEKIDAVDQVFQQYGLAERERPTIRAVLEGNHVTMASAERVWPQYYQVASETISTITECIHPTQTT